MFTAMKISIFIIVMFSFLDLSDSLCSPGGFSNTQPQFGPGCMYRCHCVGDVQCDDATGNCLRGCAAGWMGPGCQYGDIAYTKQAKQLSNVSNLFIDGRNATDGLPTTCVGPTSWVVIDLNATYRISELVINSSHAMSFQGFEVTVGNESSYPPSDVSYTCFQQITTDQLDTVTHVVCSTEIVGRYIVIRTLDNATKMTLCDVSVYGGRSLAYGRNVSQSTTINTDFGMGDASRALDGNDNTDFRKYSCTHTSVESSPWWRVNLAMVYDIERIIIYGRQDCCNERLSGFLVSFMTNYSFNLVFKHPDKTPMVITEVITLSSDLAQHVEISLNKTEALTLCEVFVFGECQNNVCGLSCDTYCYCKEPIDKHNKIRANCPSGCRRGWWGSSCNNTCDTNCKGNICNQSDGHCFECLLGKWGHFCENNCTNCLPGTECGNSNGICTVGCLTGLYGVYCSEHCGECGGDRSCNRSTGGCSHGCQQGWQDENCIIACSLGWYGINCSNICGHCANTTCDHINGTCPFGCSEGYNGTECSESLHQEKLSTESSSYLPIGALVGGALGAAGLIIIIILLAIIAEKRRNGALRGKQYQSKEPESNTSSSKLFSDVYENSSSLKLEEEHSNMKPTYENAFFNMESNRKGDISLNKTEDSGDKIGININRKETAGDEIMGESDTDETVESRAENVHHNIYYNIGKSSKRGGRKIAVQDLSDYVKGGVHLSNDIEEEFKKLLSGPQLEMNIALNPKNRHKNRYKGMYAYDRNRVILEPLSDDPDTDYINASFINGYKTDNAFIAAQGAIAATVNDFWRMIWQYDIQQIVMLTGLIEQGKQKCLQYWPNDGIHEYGMIRVELIDEDICTEYVIRSFLISKTGSKKQKKITQFHFTSWPDRGVPDTASSLVQFWKKVRHSGNALDSPILVHCSAGIGRTGTYIALDYIFDEGSEEGYVNIFECINKLRGQRIGLVQTEEQYVYLHEVVLEAFTDTGDDVSVDDFQNHYKQMRGIDPGTKRTKLLAEFEKLLEDENSYFERDGVGVKKDKRSDPKDEFLDGKLPENKKKNRCHNILPSERYRPYLSTYVQGHNDYINAVCLPTRKNRKGLIVTQMPLPDTVIDFWRLVYDYEVQSIVMLNEANVPGEAVGVYWPQKDETSRLGPFMVKVTSNVKKSSHIERMLELSKHGEEQTLSLKQFVCSVWRSGDSVPKSIDGFLNLIDDVEDCKRHSGERPILVHCMNGAERSGLFCVLWCALEKLKSDREVAIRAIVRQMRIRRQHIIPNFEQYKFCHDVVFFNLNKSTTYTNM